MVIDEAFLREWVYEVRGKAESVSRLEVADAQIGQVLAHYTENIDLWPPIEIASIIEEINTDSMKNNFYASTKNKRSSSVRGPFDGGEIERNHAKHFQKFASAHKYRFPNVSKVLKDIANAYIFEARKMDEDAAREKLEY